MRHVNMAGPTKVTGVNQEEQIQFKAAVPHNVLARILIQPYVQPAEAHEQ